MDKLRTQSDVGSAVRTIRKASSLSTSEIAERSGRSRDVLNRLEKGSDVSLSSFMAILGTLGYGITLARLGRPTLAEMQERFQSDEE